MANAKVSPFGNLVGRQSLVLPTVDEACKLACGPAVLVDLGSFDHLLEQSDLVVGVENGEARFQADKLVMAAQDADTHGMERAEPRHALDRAADEIADALLHFAGGLVGEGHREDLAGESAPGCEDVGDAGGENARLAVPAPARTSTGPSRLFDRLALLGIEARQIGRLGGTRRRLARMRLIRGSAERARGNGASHWALLRPFGAVAVAVLLAGHRDSWSWPCL